MRNQMDRELISISKFLSLVLRHRPETIGISLDEKGWMEIDDLLAAANQSGRKLTRLLLDHVVREDYRLHCNFRCSDRRCRVASTSTIQATSFRTRSQLITLVLAPLIGLSRSPWMSFREPQLHAGPDNSF
jgi:hypothetical protein